MEIVLVTHDFKLASEIYSEINDKKIFSGTVSARFGLSSGADSEEALLITQVILTISSQVAIGLFTNWLYDKLKTDNRAKITVERTEVQLDKGEIVRIITEKLRKSS
jgi:hypothetical protein